MNKNIGSIERVIRIVAGAALVTWALLGTSTAAVWGWMGIVPLATGLLGWCPPYAMLGLNTCKSKNS